jgi:inosose dehydratase
VRIGNAPVSWGVFEIAGLSGDVTYPRVMDEIAATGYAGTELGPWGFYPTEPTILRHELTRRHLALASAFVPVDLTDPAGYSAAEAEALKVADLLQALGTRELILADPLRPARAEVAGRAGPADEMSADAWRSTAEGLNRLGRRLRERGMIAVYHHHTATYVETRAEIDRLLELTDPELVGLCLDTGHAVIGGAGPREVVARWGTRIRYVHLKDADPRVLARVRAERLDYETSVRAGIFCPLGQGCVDFAGLVADLRRLGYVGWLIVEQDVVDDTGSQHSPKAAAQQSRAFLRTIIDS